MTGDRVVLVKLRPGEHVCVISDALAGAYRTWSDPVEVMVEPSRDGDLDIVEMTFRTHECPEIVNY